MRTFQLSILVKTFKSSWARNKTGFHSWVQPAGHNTGIEVYNCTARTIVPVILRDGNVASWYTCGPTVYAPSHLGHASCYVKVDIIQRILRKHFNINLVTAMNITDIDDKIIRACSEGTTWQDVAKANEASFWEDLKGLNVLEPDIKLRVSEHIPHIIDYISKLVDEGAAYVGKDNSVYFKVEQCRTYGKLQKVNMEKGVEHDVKEAAVDFVLWKAAKPREPFWDSPWGQGRPGWHIECSTMASKIFGDCIDFHAGGLDLRFPHHENEEAQSCMYHGRSQWVNYWLHAGQLYVKGQDEKMSKSLQNTVSIKDFLQNHRADVFRMACALSNYRNGMIYGDETLITAQKTLQTLIAFLSDCQAYIDGKIPTSEFNSSQTLEMLSKTESLVDTALKSDFDTSKAIGHLIHLASFVSKGIHSPNTLKGLIRSSNVDSVIAARNYCEKILSTFGFDVRKQEMNSLVGSETVDIGAILENIIALRRTIRDQAKSAKNKDLFAVSDDIRNALESSGIEVKDHEKGSSWQFVKK